MKKIILLLLLSVNLSVLSNDSLFKKNHTTALDYHEKNELAIAERLNKKIGVGINSDSDCRNKYSIDDLINLLICESFQGKKKIGVGFKFLCKGEGGINDIFNLSNQVIEWKTKRDSSKSRADQDGVIYVSSFYETVDDKVTFKTKRFEKTVNLYKGPFEVLLSQKDCQGK